MGIVPLANNINYIDADQFREVSIFFNLRYTKLSIAHISIFYRFYILAILSRY